MNEITEKLEEVLRLSEKAGDFNTVIVVSAFLGARACGDDGLLAKEVQKFIKNVLLPRAEMGSRGIGLN